MIDKVACVAAVREIGTRAAGTTDAAERVVRFFRERFRNPETGAPACPLVRFYLTKAYDELDEDRQTFAREALGSADAERISPKMRCLTLLASVGDRPEWCSPAASVGHKAIPLASEEMVRQSPMISQLILQLGLEVGQVLAPDPTILVDLDEASYNVFYVPVARESPFIPAQEGFVVPYGIESVLGVGGLLPSGELFALILFAAVPIPSETARLFRTFALSLKSALLAAAIAENR